MGTMVKIASKDTLALYQEKLFFQTRKAWVSLTLNTQNREVSFCSSTFCRYAIAILDNPKLEALWPFQPNLSITAGGIIVHLNPHLCPNRINPLVDDILMWNRSDSRRNIDISDTTNGNAVACEYKELSAENVAWKWS